MLWQLGEEQVGTEDEVLKQTLFLQCLKFSTQRTSLLLSDKLDESSEFKYC